MSRLRVLRTILEEWSSFDSDWYLDQNPDVAAARVNPFVHYLWHGKFEGRLPFPSQHFRQVIDSARLLLESVSDLDADLYAKELFKYPSRLPIDDGLPSDKFLSVFEEVFSDLGRSYPYIVCLPGLAYGGAELTGVRLVRALVERFGLKSTIVILTDDDRLEARSWLQDGVEYRVLPSGASELTAQDRSIIIELLIRAVQPNAVVCINSRACWDAILRKGKALSMFTRIYTTAYCRDFDQNGLAIGYSDTHLPKCLQWLTGVFFDNVTFLEELVERFGIPPPLRRKLQVLRQPVQIYDPGRWRPTGGTVAKRVCWAGRVSRQKNPELLLRIALCMPDVQFEVWGRGEPVAEVQFAAQARGVSNVAIMGAYASTAELPLETYDAYLYTSLWDGIPNTLLEMAAAGLPVVASDVGGICELVTSERGWRVEDYHQSEGYVRALREIMASPDEAERRVGNMRAYIANQHSWDSFRKDLFGGAISINESS